MEFNEKDAAHFVKELFAHTCDIAVAGPLMRTKCDSEHLLKLQEDLLQAMLHDVPITSNRSASNYGVRVRKILGIKCMENEADTLCIEIRQNVPKTWLKGTGSPGNSRLLLVAMLTSCGSSGYKLRNAIRTTNTHLPVCIFRGYTKVWNVFKRVIYQLLNCSFITPRLSEAHVKVVSGLWILEAMKSNQTSKLKYVVRPRSDEESVATLELHMNLNNWLNIWQTLPLAEDKVLTRSVVDEIIENWRIMVNKIFEINTVGPDELALCDLHEIKMSTFYFSKNGKIKLYVNDVESTRSILAYLTAILSGSENYDVERPIPVQLPNAKRLATSKKAAAK